VIKVIMCIYTNRWWNFKSDESFWVWG